jgi:hypothetical protein
MKKFILEQVDNGLIKTVIDDNSDGAGKKMEKKEIYILDSSSIADSQKLIVDLISDLGLFLGNDYDKDKLSINKSYGPKYILNQTELMEERKRLTHRLQELKQMNVYKSIGNG